MQDPIEKLSVKIGGFFEASATGRGAIVALVVMAMVALGGRAFSLW